MEKKSEGIEGWDGFDPSRSPGALYPNEVIYLPCVFSGLIFVLTNITNGIMVGIIRSYQTFLSCHLVEDRESVSETNLRSWSQR